MFLFFWVIPYGGDRAHKQRPTQNPGENPVKTLFMCFFLYVLLSLPKLGSLGKSKLTETLFAPSPVTFTMLGPQLCVGCPLTKRFLWPLGSRGKRSLKIEKVGHGVKDTPCQLPQSACDCFSTFENSHKIGRSDMAENANAHFRVPKMCWRNLPQILNIKRLKRCESIR